MFALSSYICAHNVFDVLNVCMFVNLHTWLITQRPYLCRMKQLYKIIVPTTRCEGTGRATRHCKVFSTSVKWRTFNAHWIMIQTNKTSSSAPVIYQSSVNKFGAFANRLQHRTNGNLKVTANRNWSKADVVELMHVPQHKPINAVRVIFRNDCLVVVVGKTADHLNAGFKSVCCGM